MEDAGNEKKEIYGVAVDADNGADDYTGVYDNGGKPGCVPKRKIF